MKHKYNTINKNEIEKNPLEIELLKWWWRHREEKKCRTLGKYQNNLMENENVRMKLL